MSRPSSDFDPEMLRLLGAIVVQWSYVEHFVSDLFTYMTKGVPFAMAIVTSSVNVSTLTKWITTLLDLSESPHGWESAVRETLAEVDDLRLDRNTLVHGRWIPGEEPGLALVYTIRLERSTVMKDDVTTVDDLNTLLDRINDVLLQLRSLLVTCGAHQS